MADNTTLNAGTGGDVIATEDMGAYKLPVTKLRVGALDKDGGDVTATNPLPISIVDGSGTGIAATVQQTNGLNEQAVFDARGLMQRDEIRVALQAVVDALTGVLQVTMPMGATDSSGRVLMVGAAPAGQPAQASPVLSAGADASGTVRTLRTDPFGELLLAADGPPGASPPAVAAFMGGLDDGGNLRPIATTRAGAPFVVTPDVLTRLDSIDNKLGALLLIWQHALNISTDPGVIAPGV